MKKFISLLLIFSLSMAFTACKGDDKVKPDALEEKVTQTEEETKTTDKPEETKAEETEEIKADETEETKADETEETKADEVTEDEGYTPLLYKVTDDDGSYIWAFGSIHFGLDEMIPLPDYVMDAYDSSEALAVECDVIEHEKNATFDSIYPYMYRDGTTIKDHISTETYENAIELMDEFGFAYVSLYDTFKPVLWWEILETSFYEYCGLSSDNGIDRTLLTLAKEEGKEVQEVESVEFQQELLAGFSPKLQELILRTTVESLLGENLEETKKELLDMVHAWCRGDAQGIIEDDEDDIEALTEEEKALVEDYNNMMLGDRNIGMVEFAVNALENDENLFICVGAAHVVGEDAMIDLLSEQGYKTEIIR